MPRRRIDSKDLIPSTHPACRMFGEIEPSIGTWHRVRWWWDESFPLQIVNCPTLESAVETIARMKRGDLSILERYWATIPIDEADHGAP